MAVTVLRADTGIDTAVGNSLVFGVAWLVGDRQRHAREEAAHEHRRAEELERSRDETARRAVADERLRIARELHDVVAHAMSVIVVQAGTGRVVIDDAPDKAREALASIETTSRAGPGGDAAPARPCSGPTDDVTAGPTAAAPRPRAWPTSTGSWRRP